MLDGEAAKLVDVGIFVREDGQAVRRVRGGVADGFGRKRSVERKVCS